MKKVVIFIALGSIAAAAYYFYANRFAPTSTQVPKGVVRSNLPKAQDDIEVVAENLQIPWEILFLPDGDMLVTERPGKLLRIGTGTKVVVSEIQGVAHVGEGGLLGAALDPNFRNSGFIYLYLTTENGGNLSNRVERYKLTGDTLTDREILLDSIPGAVFHDGGRMRFGPDGMLYITTGDANEPQKAQDETALNGKILRLHPNGNVPLDNPFGNSIWSYGHRNPQGLAWDESGQLWITEHGPSGSQSGFDEINLIGKGSNYGWPDFKGDQTASSITPPLLHSGANDTWAPAGIIYLNGSLFFAGLRGEALYEAKIGAGNKLALTAHFKGEFGRIRAVVLGPDGLIYVSTSNTDGRGKPQDGDDKIIRINPAIFTD